MTDRVAVVVLAGGPAAAPVREATGVASRALVPVAGRPMVAWVLDAIAASGAAERIVVVGAAPSDVRADVRVPDQGGFVENLFAGADACAGAHAVLVVSADVPLLSPEGVRDVMLRAPALDADLVYPIVEVELCHRQFPGMKRTALRLKEGEYTGGNAVYLRPAFLMRQRPRIDSVYGARKSPLRLALMVGPWTAFRVLATVLPIPSSLTLPGLEEAVSRLVGGKARALVTTHADLAADVDRVEDLKIADRLLAERR